MRIRSACVPYAIGALSVSVPCGRRRWTRGRPFSFKDLAGDGLGIDLVVLTALADR